MTILEIHPSCLAELRTVNEKYLSLEDQQVVFVMATQCCNSHMTTD